MFGFFYSYFSFTSFPSPHSFLCFTFVPCVRFLVDMLKIRIETIDYYYTTYYITKTKSNFIWRCHSKKCFNLSYIQYFMLFAYHKYISLSIRTNGSTRTQHIHIEHTASRAAIESREKMRKNCWQSRYDVAIAAISNQPPKGNPCPRILLSFSSNNLQYTHTTPIHRPFALYYFFFLHRCVEHHFPPFFQLTQRRRRRRRSVLVARQHFKCMLQQ